MKPVPTSVFDVVGTSDAAPVIYQPTAAELLAKLDAELAEGRHERAARALAEQQARDAELARRGTNRAAIARALGVRPKKGRRRG